MYLKNFSYRKWNDVFMRIDEKVNVYGKSGHIAKSKVIYFRDYPDKFYEDLVTVFNEEKLLNNTFKDNEWQLYSRLDSFYRTLNFNLDDKFNNALKCFILVKMRIGRAASTILGEFYNITDLAIESDNFSNLDKYKKHMEKRVIASKSGNKRIANNLLSFLIFYNDPNLNDYIQYTKTLKYTLKKNTDLPDFNDVLLFDEIVNDYFKHSTAEQHNKYLIVYMWWTITNIIPMRPSEFLPIKKNCLNYDSNSRNPYSMNVPRIKDINTLHTQELREDKVFINKDIYTKITEAMNVFLKVKSDSSFLFSIESHYKLSSDPLYKKSPKRKEFITVYLR